jgi:type IV secretory pathway TrbD component
MDEEFEMLKAQWKSVEFRPLPVVRTLVRAQRLQTLLWVGLAAMGTVTLAVVGAVLLRNGVALRGPFAAGRLAVGAVAGLFLLGYVVFAMLRDRRDRAALSDAPQSVVRYLVSLRERELFWFTDRTVVFLSGLLMVAMGAFLLVLWISHPAEQRAAVRMGVGSRRAREGARPQHGVPQPSAQRKRFRVLRLDRERARDEAQRRCVIPERQRDHRE